MTVHTYSIERLLHIRCGACAQWWSVGDGSPTGAWACPRCGVRASLKPKPVVVAPDAGREGGE